MHSTTPRLAALLFANALLLPGQALAHKPYYKAYLTDVGGQRNVAHVELAPTRQGRVKLEMSEPLPGAGTGTLVVTAALNRVPVAPLTYAIDSLQETWPLGLETANQDKVEILDVAILDEAGTPWGKLGTAGPPPNQSLRGKYSFVAPLVYVVDTASDVAFTRGGDTMLLPTGFWTVGFDALRSRSTGAHLNAVGLYAEIEFRRNGGPWETQSVGFDVKSGKSQPSGRPGLHFGFAQGDVVAVKRVEVFDRFGNLFAKVGIRMGLAGKYRERHALDTSTPIATGEHDH